MTEWWEYKGICTGCKKPVRNDDPAHDCADRTIDTSWQSRVNPSNARWRPGYRFKTAKNSGYRTYQCYYSVDINGKIKFDGGVHCADEKARIAEWQEQVDTLPAGNWYPGCELEDML